MKRRAVILGTASLGLVAYGGTVGLGLTAQCHPFLADNPVFASGRRIGERLLAQGFAEFAITAEDLPQFYASLADKIQADFACGDTVDCDGWVMSRSEAVFCVSCARLDQDANA